MTGGSRANGRRAPWLMHLRGAAGRCRSAGARSGGPPSRASLLRDAASGIGDAQSVLRAAEDLAAQNKLTIGADGSVSAEPAPPLLAGAGPASLLVQAPSPAAGEVADLVGRALSVADDVDTQITARLVELGKFAGASPAAASALQGADRLPGSFDHAILPRGGTSRAGASQWWAALSAGQRQRL